MFMHVPQMIVLRLHDWTTSRSCGKFQDFCKSTFRDWNFHETFTDLKHSSTPQTFAFIPRGRGPRPEHQTAIHCLHPFHPNCAALAPWNMQSGLAPWMILLYFIWKEKKCPSDWRPCPSKISPARIISLATKKRKTRTRLPQVGALRGHGMRCFKVWCHCGVVIYLWWYLKTFDESHRCRLC